MNALIDAALDRSRTIISALVFILIAGSVAFVSIPKEAEPDINIPIIYVLASHDGISPEDSERLIVRPLEEKLRTIEGLKEMRNAGFEGGASFVLEFDAGFDADLALTDVREKVDAAKPDLPEDTEEPVVEEVNLSLFPILVVTIAGDVPERTLVRVARDLRDEIERIPTVLKAEIAGDREDMVEVIVDPVKLESYGINARTAIEIMGNSNLIVAAGRQDTGKGRFSVKVPGLFKTAADILNMPLVSKGDAVIRVRDVAEVRRTFQDPDGFARVGGKTAIALEVSKRTGENIIETIEQVRAVVEAERGAWPNALKEAISVDFSQDKSHDIRDMLTDLQNNVLMAVVLVMIVIVAALGLRSALLVGISIPGSFLTGILVLAGLGLTMNIVVLFSLILAVGMLVDGAIVVTEYADRKMVAGETPRAAYGMAAKRMAWPITASTATTLVAFLPLVFWPGAVGEFMKFMPITLLATLAASLVMALIFVPTLGSIFGRPGAVDAKMMRVISAGEEGDLSTVGGITGAYLAVLRGALRYPGRILLAAVMLLIGTQWFYATHGRGVEFFPNVEPRNAKLQVRARGNLSIFEQNTLMREIEDRIVNMGEFQTVYTRTGKPERNEEAEDIIGTINLEFTDWKLRRKADVILADVRERTADLAGIIIDARKEEGGPPTGKDVQIQLSSRFPELLIPAVRKIREGLEKDIAGLIAIEDSRPLPGIDWVIEVDRAQAYKYSVDVNAIGQAIRLATSGIKLDEFRPDDTRDEVEIRVRYPVDYRTIHQLDQIRIPTSAGGIPLSNFVTRTAKPSVGDIQRVDGKRVMTVKADVEPGILPSDKVAEVTEWLKTLNLDSRIDIGFKGEDEEQREAQEFLSKAFLVALFMMAIILVTQFNSFYSAFLILSAVVMSTIGVFIGLLITDQPFGIVMSGVGVIALAGIVVNNNIVLIDTFDQVIKTVKDPMEAVLRTGAQRMRPVLLTSVTTILGLMPMVLGTNIDFVTREISVGAPSTQWWTQLATAIVFGLGFATILTLVVTPSALMFRANIQAWRRRRRLRGAPQA
ncbi:MAG: efflux RND transporter permease subunit, partial [Proteobacteria bacterium]|nr:efflux RND transporter permease subunit [Pseudomonadota bacterium]